MPISVFKIDNENKDWGEILHKQHREVVLEAEDLYPGIDIWYDKTATPGIESGERVGYLVQKDNMPVGAAIAKRGENAKICTIRVRDEGVNEGIGSILFLLLAHSLRKNTKYVHFTAPENLWIKYEFFFKDIGFVKYGYSETQYRLFDREIIATAEYSKFKYLVNTKYLTRMAGLLSNIDNEKIDIMFSIKPEYARRIINLTKIMELRRKFSKKWIGRSALIYSSAPEKAIIGKFKIKDVIKDNPIAIWEKWREAIDCSEEEFFQYTRDTNEIYGILIDDVREIGPIFKDRLEEILQENLSSPQSYIQLKKTNRWEKAIGVSQMLLRNI